MMFYHGSDKKRHKDQVNKMATRDTELSVRVRSLSKRKSTGSMLTLMELNKRISLQERVYRKRKLKSMVIFLIFLLSHCTVERSV